MQWHQMARRKVAWAGVLLAGWSLASPAASGQESSDLIEVQIAVLQYVMERNNAHAPGDANTAICVGIGGAWDPETNDVSDRMLAQLTSEILPIVPRSACVLDREYQYAGRWRPRLVHRETRLPAIAITVGRLTEPVTSPVRIMAGYYEDVLSGAEYRCTVEYEAAHWLVRGCELSAIS